MTYTATVADTGATFSTINSAVSSIQANSAVVLAGLQIQNIVLNTLAVGYNPTAPDIYGGWSANGFTSVLGATSGNSANGNASVLTRALIYNQSNGAYWNQTGESYPNTGITITVDNTTVSDLQIYASHQGYGNGTLDTSTNSFVLTSCILKGGGNGGGINIGGGSAKIELCLFTINNNFAPPIRSSAAPGTTISIYNNTMVNVTGSTGGNGINIGNYPTVKCTNNAIINFTNELANNGFTITGSNNATTNATPANAKFPTTAEQLSVALTDFVGGASLNDFRLASGAAKLRSTGTSVSGISFDWTGSTAIPQGSEYDIGCWAFLPSGTGISVSESGSAADTVAETMTAAVAVSESGSAADAEAVSARIADAEAGAAVDTIGETMRALIAVSEAGTASDTISETMRALISVSEAGTAVDTITATVSGAFAIGVSESGSAADTISETMTALISVSEAGAALDTITVALAGTFFIGVSESGAAADSFTVTGGVQPTPPVGPTAGFDAGPGIGHWFNLAFKAGSGRRRVREGLGAEIEALASPEAAETPEEVVSAAIEALAETEIAAENDALERIWEHEARYAELVGERESLYASTQAFVQAVEAAAREELARRERAVVQRREDAEMVVILMALG